MERCTYFGVLQDRYKLLKEQSHEDNNQNVKNPANINSDQGISLEKSLSAAVDSFDNLFCRRCLVCILDLMF